MKNTILLSFALLLLFSCGGNNETADKVFINGFIYTVEDNQPTVEAVAIKDGIIIAVVS